MTNHLDKNSLAYFAYGNGPSLIERQKQSSVLLTIDERLALASALRHLLGEPFEGDLRLFNPLWRSVIRKIEDES